MAEDAPPPKAVTRGQRRAAVRVLNELSKEKSLERSRGYPWILDRAARIIICKVLYRRLALLLHTDKRGADADLAAMQKLNEAWDKIQLYDKQSKAHRGTGSDASDGGEAAGTRKPKIYHLPVKSRIPERGCYVADRKVRYESEIKISIFFLTQI